MTFDFGVEKCEFKFHGSRNLDDDDDDHNNNGDDDNDNGTVSVQ